MSASCGQKGENELHEGIGASGKASTLGCPSSVTVKRIFGGETASACAVRASCSSLWEAQEKRTRKSSFIPSLCARSTAPCSAASIASSSGMLRDAHQQSGRSLASAACALRRRAKCRANSGNGSAGESARHTSDVMSWNELSAAAMLLAGIAQRWSRSGDNHLRPHRALHLDVLLTLIQS